MSRRYNVDLRATAKGMYSQGVCNELFFDVPYIREMCVRQGRLQAVIDSGLLASF